MKLNFVCIGAQKAGTTSLHDILSQHPSIYLPPNKEAQFFDINERYEKGLNYYFETFFDTYSNQEIIGNINPNLDMNTRSIQRLYDCFGPELKIIYILRDPTKRAYSHYLMSKSRSFENLSFFDALEKESERLQSKKEHPYYLSKELGHFELNHFAYVYRGLYTRNIEYLFNLFPKDNIKIILFEDFIKDSESYFSEITDFIGVTKKITPQLNQISNAATKSRSHFISRLIYGRTYLKRIFTRLIPATLKRSIKLNLIQLNSKKLTSSEKKLNEEDLKIVYQKYFKEEIDKLEKLLHHDLSSWKH